MELPHGSVLGPIHAQDTSATWSREHTTQCMNLETESSWQDLSVLGEGTVGPREPRQVADTKKLIIYISIIMSRGQT